MIDLSENGEILAFVDFFFKDRDDDLAEDLFGDVGIETRQRLVFTGAGIRGISIKIAIHGSETIGFEHDY